MGLTRTGMIVRAALWAVGLIGLAAAGVGCNVVAAGAQFLTRPGDIDAAYKGLANQTVAVMVWVDHGPALDYPLVQSDIAKGLTLELHDIVEPKVEKEKDKEKAKEKVPEALKNAQFRDPMSVIRFQQNHPEFEGMPIEQVASRLGVTRVIYVEVYNFQTRSNLSVDLYRGTIQSKIQVLEVSAGANGQKTAKVAYTEPDLRVNYPEKDVEGVEGALASEQQVYQLTIKTFVTQVGQRFYKHESNE